MEPIIKKHFVLVHGACHGGWSWYKLKPLLEGAGHKVTALDLAASGIDSRKIEQLHTLRDYTLPLMELMESLPQDEKVILVGHSLGGMNLGLAMEKYPKKIYAAVFLAAFMPDSIHMSSYVLNQYNERTPAENWLDTQFLPYGSPEQPLTSIFLLFSDNSGPFDLSLTLTPPSFSPLSGTLHRRRSTSDPTKNHHGRTTIYLAPQHHWRHTSVRHSSIAADPLSIFSFVSNRRNASQTATYRPPFPHHRSPHVRRSLAGRTTRPSSPSISSLHLQNATLDNRLLVGKQHPKPRTKPRTCLHHLFAVDLHKTTLHHQQPLFRPQNPFQNHNTAIIEPPPLSLSLRRCMWPEPN